MKEAVIFCDDSGNDTDMAGDKVSSRCSIIYKRGDRVRNDTSGERPYNRQFRDKGQQRHKDK